MINPTDGNKPPPHKSMVSVVNEAWGERSGGSPTNTSQLQHMLAGHMGDLTVSDD